MKTLRSYLTGEHRGLLVIDETADEPSLADFPWTIYVETDALDPLFQKFQREHAKFLKDWMKKNIN
jgi:hypothetical protein